MASEFTPAGVIPATLLALGDDYTIDEPETRRHLRDVAATEGLSAITVNGHASEVHACSIDEQRRLLDISLDEIGATLPVIAGIYADGSLEAARLARMAQSAGAAALLVFPPGTLAMGGHLRPEMTLAHFRTIADATDLPLICFCYPERSNLHTPLPTLLELCEQVPTLRAIKDWCNDPQLHERHIRTLQTRDRPVNVLTTHSAWLMASLVLRPAGLLSGAGSVIPELQVALWRAVQAHDLAAAQRINDRIYPLAEAFYRPPFLDMHNRMKEALVLLGRQRRAVVRPPLVRLPPEDIEGLRQAIAAAGIGAVFRAVA